METRGESSTTKPPFTTPEAAVFQVRNTAVRVIPRVSSEHGIDCHTPCHVSGKGLGVRGPGFPGPGTWPPAGASACSALPAVSFRVSEKETPTPSPTPPPSNHLPSLTPPRERKSVGRVWRLKDMRFGERGLVGRGLVAILAQALFCFLSHPPPCLSPSQ